MYFVLNSLHAYCQEAPGGCFFGIVDTIAFEAALVLCSGGLSAALVCDLVLYAGAIWGILIGVDTVRCLCLTPFLG